MGFLPNFDPVILFIQVPHSHARKSTIRDITPLFMGFRKTAHRISGNRGSFVPNLASTTRGPGTSLRFHGNQGTEMGEQTRLTKNNGKQLLWAYLDHAQINLHHGVGNPMAHKDLNQSRRILTCVFLFLFFSYYFS